MNTLLSSGYIQERLMEQLLNSIKAPFPDLTPRYLYGRITLPGKATAVIGIRRAGKTYFLHQIRRQKFQENQATREQLPYLNLEDERLAGLHVHHLSGLIEAYYRRFPAFRGKQTVTWCFDEIQVVPGWEQFIRRLMDTEKVEIFVSGSSAALLSREIATAMRGRSWEVPIFPFSFREFLRHKGQEIPEQPGELTAAERSHLENTLLEYLTCGGFPEAQGLDITSRFRLLSDYVDVAILRDVVERHQVRNVSSLRWLVRHLLGNPGALFSIEKFYAALKSQGLMVSRDTLHNLLGYLEDCFLIRITWIEAASERQRMVNPRKIYPIDPGLIPIFDRTGRANLGHALETVIRIELERRGLMVTYIRTRGGYEVDFLARSPGGEQALIQVCADLGDPQTVEREVRALQEASQNFPGAQQLLITLTPEVGIEVPPSIKVYSATAWLLKNQII